MRFGAASGDSRRWQRATECSAPVGAAQDIVLGGEQGGGGQRGRGGGDEGEQQRERHLRWQ
eukprot:SAG31_NODE_1758_length_7335_cov_18.704600_6_plen_61_part_00